LWGALMKNDQPTMYGIKRVEKNTLRIKTFFLEGVLSSSPGQFFMLWLPGVGEKPFALSYSGKSPAFTIELKGRFTRAMFNVKPGDQIGIRGPYGTGFRKPSGRDRICVVAGGLGIAPLAPLIESTGPAKPKQAGSVSVIYGAKTKRDLLFLERFKGRGIKHCTDDGSFGFRGYTTDMLKTMLDVNDISAVYTCGPEVMMKKVFELCEMKSVRCYASLERYMGCGMGICGSCACGDRLVCKDGPVFSSEQLKGMHDFGRYALLRSGKKVGIKSFFEWRS